jgi:hypothetical protein
MAAEIPSLAAAGRYAAGAPADGDRRPGPMPSLRDIVPGPLPSLPTRLARTAGVAAAWALGVLPASLGWQRCTLALLFHQPCPGCGMTRAVHLLVAGHLEASLQMHPLAVPVLAVWGVFMGATLWATWTQGTPLALLVGRLGRGALIALAVVYAAMFVLWGLRWFGLFGGPVAVG